MPLTLTHDSNTDADILTYIDGVGNEQSTTLTPEQLDQLRNGNNAGQLADVVRTILRLAPDVSSPGRTDLIELRKLVNPKPNECTFTGCEETAYFNQLPDGSLQAVCPKNHQMRILRS